MTTQNELDTPKLLLENTITDEEFTKYYLRYILVGDIRGFNIEWMKRFRAHNEVEIIGDGFVLHCPPLRASKINVPKNFSTMATSLQQAGSSPLTELKLHDLSKQIEMHIEITPEIQEGWVKVFKHYGVEFDEEAYHETNKVLVGESNIIEEEEDWV